MCIRRQCINDQSQGEPWVQVPGLFCHLQTNFPYSCSRHPFLVVRGALSPNLESNPMSKPRPGKSLRAGAWLVLPLVNNFSVLALLRVACILYLPGCSVLSPNLESNPVSATLLEQ